MARPHSAATAARFLMALALAAGAHPARSAVDTDILTVTATVLSACSLSGGTLDFGQYISGQTNNVDVNGTINYVNCSGNLSIALDGGTSGNIDARQMSQGASKLNYQLYRTAQRVSVWGSGADAQGVILIGTQSGSQTVYGRIPANQIVPPGTYTDTVNITMTF
jgi:spore coat protein U-like protein